MPGQFIVFSVPLAHVYSCGCIIPTIIKDFHLKTLILCDTFDSQQFTYPSLLTIDRQSPTLTLSYLFILPTVNG